MMTTSTDPDMPVQTDAPYADLADPGEVAAILGGYHSDPCSFLGMHQHRNRLVLRVSAPNAVSVEVLDERGAVLTRLEPVDAAGFFAGYIPRDEAFPYKLQISWPTTTQITEDAYRFGTFIDESELWRFVNGEHAYLYRILGAHPRVMDGVAGVGFAVWAPNAQRVSVVGDFNSWDGRRHPMRVRHTGGVWELFIPGIESGSLYKYELTGADGNLLPLKADPFGTYAELRPATSSIVAPPTLHVWQDAAWLERRAHTDARSAPISCYEVHLDSWQRKADNTRLTYRELAETLVPYALEHGFTHLELMPISEYPFDGSWGYQPVGLFAPTSRYGTPDDFRFFVDAAHNAGLGVILDWVPGHFPVDAHGLAHFDGSYLYEHADPRQGFHPDWNTAVYNYGRPEVRAFLISNALFWLREFHIDGLRVDAVASMLYLDYSRKEGEWIPNQYGGRENLEAISFLQRTNELAYAEFPGVLMIAEESTAFSGVSAPVFAGGLGFGFKWNMGWMHDTLSYMSREGIHRRYHQNEITFSIMYAYSENYVLPLSHDEVVHGKGSLLSRMPGDGWQKFANLRTLYAYMFTHPGKKLLFMGAEIAQGMEWSAERSLDWFLLEYAQHRGIRDLVVELNHLYRSLPALHELDNDAAGFEWIDIADAQSSVISYVRRAKNSNDFLVVVCNFTAVVRDDYSIGVPQAGQYEVVINSDDRRFDGSGAQPGSLLAINETMHGRPASLALRLPPLGVLVLRLQQL